MATRQRQYSHRELTAADFRELRKLSGLTNEELARRMKLAYWTVVNMQRGDRHFGRKAARRWLDVLVERPKEKPVAPLPPEVMNELREQGRDRAYRSTVRDPELRELIDQDKTRRDKLQTDDGLLDEFLSVWAQPAGPESVMCTPVGYFEQAFVQFCQDEGLKRDPAKLAKLVNSYLRRHYQITPAGVRGLFVRWHGKAPSMPEHASRQPNPRRDVWEPEVRDSIESEIARSRTRPGLRYRWGERPRDIPAGRENDPRWR